MQVATSINGNKFKLLQLLLVEIYKFKFIIYVLVLDNVKFVVVSAIKLFDCMRLLSNFYYFHLNFYVNNYYSFYGSGSRISTRSVGPGVGGADIGLPSVNTS